MCSSAGHSYIYSLVDLITLDAFWLICNYKSFHLRELGWMEDRNLCNTKWYILREAPASRFRKDNKITQAEKSVDTVRRAKMCTTDLLERRDAIEKIVIGHIETETRWCPNPLLSFWQALQMIQTQSLLTSQSPELPKVLRLYLMPLLLMVWALQTPFPATSKAAPL